MKTRYDELLENFLAFHRRNPKVWERFCALTFQLIRRGRTHYSSSAIIEVVRYHTTLGDKPENAPLKINDHTKAFYGRMFMLKYPQHEGFFRIRKQKSQESAAGSQAGFRFQFEDVDLAQEQELRKYMGVFHA